MRARDAVLLVAHGTVERLDDLPAFLDRIRGGRPVSEAFVRALRGRYEAIGGSPLNTVTREQAALLSERLGTPVFVGMRLWDPSIDKALADALDSEVERLVVIPLAPFSVHVYWQAAEQARDRVREARGRAPELVGVEAWGNHPAFVEAHAELIRARARPDARLVLSAHSLPVAAIRAGDPYERLVGESARAIAARAGREYDLAFQSQGEGSAAWLGPDLLATFESAKERGESRVVVTPFGFLGEHVETLYDLDIEAKRQATELGLAFERLPALGTDAQLLDALEDLSRSALA